MDSLTHVVIGACIGEAICGQKLGKRALLLGAIAQSLPDVDFLAALWMRPAENLLAHRGFTHSLLFVAAVTPFLALWAERLHRPHNIALKKWMVFFGVEGLVHIFIDGFNAYGIGWLEPFSSRRFSFNTLFVVDPLFTIGPALAMLALLLLNRRHKTRPLWWITGLLACGAYLTYAVSNKLNIDRYARELITERGLRNTGHFETPTPLNNFLWYIVIRTDSGCYVTYRSVLDTERTSALRFFPKNDSLLHNVADRESIQHLIRFSQGYYTVDRWQDTLVFNDLRFGQINGWLDPREKFVFHYYLQQGADNALVVQRGRFAKWDERVLRSLLERIKGQ